MYPDFFEKGYRYKFDKDVSHYLDKIADRTKKVKLRGICHRITRVMVDIYNLKSKEELVSQLEKNIDVLKQL